uniref:Uncharacterized protein n=1 Tax=Rhizophora mucronata TaxID=61149 RepID=A0A2P2LU84_RHIMU
MGFSLSISLNLHNLEYKNVEMGCGGKSNKRVWYCG